MDFDINSAVAMLLMHNVDFEVIHGIDYKGEAKVCIVAKFETPVRLDFGDRKHGRRISRIYPLANYKIALKSNDFRQMLKEHTVKAEWRSGSSGVLPS